MSQIQKDYSYTNQFEVTDFGGTMTHSFYFLYKGTPIYGEQTKYPVNGSPLDTAKGMLYLVKKIQKFITVVNSEEVVAIEPPDERIKKIQELVTDDENKTAANDQEEDEYTPGDIKPPRRLKKEDLGLVEKGG